MLAFVSIAVCIVVDTLAIYLIIYELAFVSIAVCKFEDTITIFFVTLPPAACPSKNALSTLVTVFELALEFVAIVIVFDSIIWHL